MEYADQIIDACPDAVVICDSSGIIRAWSSGATKLFGWSSREAVGQRVVSLFIPPDDQPHFEEGLRLLVTRNRRSVIGSRRRMTVMSRHRDRIAVHLWYRAILLEGTRCVIGFVRSLFSQQPSVSSDAGMPMTLKTDGKHSSDVNPDSPAQAARTVGPETSELLANITHELRTPMNAILGMTDLALHEDVPDVVRDYLLTARDSAKTMLSLINDILDFSRLEVDQSELDIVSFDIRRLLDETMRGLSLRAHEKGLELAATVNADVPFRIKGDPIRLRQMLTNLVGNAVKFTQTGEIVVTVQLVHRGEDTSPEWNVGDRVTLQFCVTDTGIGIDPKDHNRIFVPFAQADASTTRSYAGTGLGLSICSELAKRMQGRIWVESSLGHGSKFSFTAEFDVTAASEERLRGPALTPEQLEGTRVLIVDDNQTTRRILKDMVESWRMRVSIADSVESAMDQMEAASAEGDGFSLLLVDAVMPRRDGIDLLEQIQHATETVGASILMMSPIDQHLFRKRAVGLPVGAFLEKPVSQSNLLNSISEAIGQSPMARPFQQAVEHASESLNILVAEDIPANQKVIKVILGKRGHHATIAHNGREAIDLFERGDFDVVLMDVQMPILDGLQATRAIRGLENQAGKHTPIVAITAHAVRGDREACLAAGMDGYLSKPLDAQSLLQTVEQLSMPRSPPDSLMKSIVTKSGRWRFRKENASREKSSERVKSLRPAHSTDPEFWIPAVALRRMGDDKALLLSMVDFFLEDSPGLLLKLRELIDADNAAEASRIAHSLKGLCANFEAGEAIHTAGDIERACRHGKLKDAECLLDSLQADIRNLSLSLASWTRNSAES